MKIVKFEIWHDFGIKDPIDKLIYYSSSKFNIQHAVNPHPI